jgi:gas vesicle protein
MDGLEDKIRHLERLQEEGDKNLGEVREEGLAKDSEIERYAKQAKRLADLNEELRELFEEERNAMTDEQERIEDEIEQIHHQNERKQQMYKGKLYLLLSALSLGKEIRVSRDTVTIDELFKELQEVAHQMPKTVAMAAQGAPVSASHAPSLTFLPA